MIKKLVVSNFRSLGPDIHFEPGKLCFFIGPNGSGKSNILDVLSFVRDCVMQGLPAAITHRRGIDSVRRRSHGRPFDVHIEFQLLIDQQHVTYEFIITGDRLEEYRVKTEKAIMYGPNGEKKVSFIRNGHEWNGPEGVAPFMDEQSLALTALGGTKQFKPLVDFLSGLTVYSIFPESGQREPKLPSAHRTVRTGPYTAPHVTLIH